MFLNALSNLVATLSDAAALAGAGLLLSSHLCRSLRPDAQPVLACHLAQGCGSALLLPVASEMSVWLAVLALAWSLIALIGGLWHLRGLRPTKLAPAEMPWAAVCMAAPVAPSKGPASPRPEPSLPSRSRAADRRAA